MKKVSVQNYYQKRFTKDENLARQEVWKILCSSVFQKYVKQSDTVCDVGAGYCEFINNIKCAKKYAIDINPDVSKFASKDVTIYRVRADKTPDALKGKVDVIFMSNFLEHLSTKEEVLDVMANANTMLKKGGLLLILQPNIDLVKEKFWDFIDHKIPLNRNSLYESLKITGFKVEVFAKRFLPYTTKRSLPVNSALTQIYLKIPPYIRPFAGQSFVVAKKI